MGVARLLASVSMKSKIDDVLESFDFSEHLGVFGSDKVDCDTLSAESTTSTDSVDVVLLGGG